MTPEMAARLMAEQILKEGEEVSPVGMNVIRYIEVDDAPNNDNGVTENAGSSPLGITDMQNGFDTIIPGQPHLDPNGDLMS